MPTLETYNGYPLWRYVPSLPAAIVFAIAFALLTTGHIMKMSKHRMWFCIPFVAGGIFEVVGYAGRAAAHSATGELIPYVLQSTFLLLAPILFAASLYMTLSRIIQATQGARCSIIRPRWLTAIFVTGDCFSFLVQASGAGLRVKAGTGDDDADPRLGSDIIVGGLLFQIVIFGVFLVTAVVFNRRFARDPAAEAILARRARVPWQASLNMLYAASAMVMTRNVFRVVEYAMGGDGYLLGVEWGVYVFDAALMAVTMACFFWWYPSQLKPAIKSRDRRLSSDVEMEASLAGGHGRDGRDGKRTGGTERGRAKRGGLERWFRRMSIRMQSFLFQGITSYRS